MFPRVDAYLDAQFQVEVAVLYSLVQYARNSMNATKVALVGHSYCAYISVASAASAGTGADIDAVVLTGLSGTFAYFAPFVSGVGLRIAALQDPRRWGDLSRGYLTAADVYAEAYGYFACEPQGLFDHAVVEWTYAVGSEPFAVGELPTMLATDIPYANVTAPVLLLQGQYDASACGGNCVGVLNTIKGNLTGAPVVKVVDDLPAGLVTPWDFAVLVRILPLTSQYSSSHNLFLHKVAPRAFQITLEFLKAQGISLRA
jgi:pimeloyl-ACP methyl ester carboxylesterase